MQCPNAPSRERSPVLIPSRCRVQQERASSELAVREPQRIRKRKARSETPRSLPPPLEFPEPGAPPPRHLFRNQPALLGNAGLISGVHPARLPRERREPGTSAGDPIVLRDDDRRPLDPDAVRATITSLPAPSTDAVILSLARSKNLSPILTSLRRLLSSATPLPPPPLPSTPSHPSQPAPERLPSRSDKSNTSLAAPPLKRRKLSRVPAGAADWDVPYPFREGEGPEQYADKWHRDRIRTLVAQLLGLVKAATRSAAAREYLARVGTAGLARAQEEARKIGRASKSPTPTPKTPSDTRKQPANELDEFIAGIFGASESTAKHGPSTEFDELMALFADANTSTLFNDFPLPPTSSQQTSPPLKPPTESGPAPLINLPMTATQSVSNPLADPTSLFPPVSSAIAVGDATPVAEPDHLAVSDHLFSFDPSVIDPALLMLSAPTPALPLHGVPEPENGASSASTPMLALSPSASMCSFGPMTPRVAWEEYTEVVGLEPEGDHGPVHNVKEKQALSDNLSCERVIQTEITPGFGDEVVEVDSGPAIQPPSLPSAQSQQHQTYETRISPVPGPSLQYAPRPPLTTQDVLAAQSAAIARAREDSNKAFLRTFEAQNTTEPVKKKKVQPKNKASTGKGKGRSKVAKDNGNALGQHKSDSKGKAAGAPTGDPDKQTIIARARARRDALASELADTRIALWESFIEGGTLQFLIRDAGGVIPPDPHT